MSFTIRKARADESAIVTDIAYRAKAHWGYLPEYMESWRPLMVITPEKVGDGLFYVAEQDDQILGYVAVYKQTDEVMELDDLFIAPEAMGKGVGRALLEFAIDIAKSLGFPYMELDADPFAEPFYRHMGAYGICFKQSAIYPERLLPRMKFDLS